MPANLERLPFIKGAVGRGDLARLGELGANAVRIGLPNQALLDEAHAAGLGLLVGLPVRAERDGMDYDDTKAIARQHESVLDIVNQFKDHPAVWMWCIGNELDHIPGEKPYNRNVWDVVNQIARDVRACDGRHAMLTAVGTGRFGKIEECVAQCPDLDLLGINAYAKIGQIDGQLREHGWTKPYLFTEWGMSGAWERPKTEWLAPFEESSATKAACYRRRYQQAIAAYPDRCLGGFVFYWGWRHETTLSWYNMRGPAGHEMESVATMEGLWKDAPIDASAPHLFGVRLNGFAPPDNVYLTPGETVPAEALTAPQGTAPDQTFAWEVRPEVEYGDYAGRGEVLPDGVPDAIDRQDDATATVRAPLKEGKYRVFAYLYDGHNRFATANMPFYAGELHAG